MCSSDLKPRSTSTAKCSNPLKQAMQAMGFVLFMVIYVLVLHGLWQQRQQWYVVGLWASGVGLAFVGVVLPVWADDTVSIVWWGLTAAVCSKNYNGEIYGISHKKTA